MPEARLRRTRSAYPARDLSVPIVTAPPVFVDAPERFRIGATIRVPYNFGPPCWCTGLPDGVDVAQCPAHPVRTVRRGPTGATD